VTLSTVKPTIRGELHAIKVAAAKRRPVRLPCNRCN